MDIPQIILKPTFEVIDKLKQLANCTCQELSCIPNENHLLILDNELSLKFQSIYTDELNRCFSLEVPEFHFVSNGQEYIVLNGASFIDGTLVCGSPEKMDFKIDMNTIVQSSLIDGKEHYWRYVYPVDTSEWFLKVSASPYKDDFGYINNQALLRPQLDNHQMQMFTKKYNGRYYMVIESNEPITQEDMEHRSMSLIVAIGIVLGKRYGDHRFIVASDAPDFCAVSGVGVMKLQKTKYCPYHIFDTNKVNIVAMLKRYDYQKYAKDEIDGSDTSATWYNDDNTIMEDAFCKLADLCYTNNDLLVAASMMLDGSMLGIEYQKPFYHVALETITTALMKDEKMQQSPVVDKNIFKNKVRPALQTALDEVTELSEDARRILGLRIQNNLNAPANQDKLSYLFQKFGYNLTKEDEDAIKKRNTSFHGHLTNMDTSLRQQEDDLFSVSLRLHKLCCILLLKAAGYQGKILNNEVLFGIKEACERKEHAYIEI